MKIQVKRIYDDPAPGDGYRVLVDRLWPRGVSKERADLDEWAKEVAPSTELREWLHVDRDGRYAEFVDKYRTELEHNPAVEELAHRLEQHPTVTLLTANHLDEPTQVDELEDFLKRAIARDRRG